MSSRRMATHGLVKAEAYFVWARQAMMRRHPTTFNYTFSISKHITAGLPLLAHPASPDGGRLPRPMPAQRH